MKTLKFVLGGGILYSSPECKVINLVSEGSVCVTASDGGANGFESVGDGKNDFEYDWE